MAEQTEGVAGGTFEAIAGGGDARYDLLPCYRVTFQRRQIFSHPFPAFELVECVAEACGGVWRRHQSRPSGIECTADLACPLVACFFVERSIDQEQHETIGTGRFTERVVRRIRVGRRQPRLEEAQRAGLDVVRPGHQGPRTAGAQ